MKANNKIKAVVWIIGVLGLFVSAIVFAVLLHHQSPYYKSSKLIEAINNKNYTEVEAILSTGVNPNIPEFRITVINAFFEVAPRLPLSVACDNDDIEAVKMLIRYGATAEPMEGTDWSPLRKAIFSPGSNSLEIIIILLDNGADPYYVEGNSNAFFAAAEVPGHIQGEDISERSVAILDYMLVK